MPGGERTSSRYWTTKSLRGSAPPAREPPPSTTTRPAQRGRLRLKRWLSTDLRQQHSQIRVTAQFRREIVIDVGRQPTLLHSDHQRLAHRSKHQIVGSARTSLDEPLREVVVSGECAVRAIRMLTGQLGQVRGKNPAGQLRNTLAQPVGDRNRRAHVSTSRGGPQRSTQLFPEDRGFTIRLPRHSTPTRQGSPDHKLSGS